MRKMIPAALAAVLAGGPAHAQDITTRINQIFSSVTPNSPGCVIGVSQNGTVLVNRAYGMADLERRVALTPESVFDVGSVTKHFIAAGVLLLVEEGRISLSDDIRKHIPELPDYGHSITIDHLLTHTSGIRDWVWLSQVTGGKHEVLTLILRQRNLNFAPGEEWSYSNSNYELLRELVRRVSGQSLAEFTRLRLFEPLGMHSTRYAVDVREVANHATAYEKDGEGWKPDMLLGNARGGGGVFSTASDLLLWNDGLTHERLGAFVTSKLQEPARLANGRRLSYARGLIVDGEGDDQIVWHAGDAAGFNSVVARVPQQGLSLALLCNAGDVSDEENYEIRILDLFMPPAAAEAGAAAPGAESLDMAPPDLSSRAGLFFSDPTGDPLRLVVTSGRLRVAGGPALVALDKDRFRNPRGVTRFMSQDEFELHFLSPDEFELRSMEGRTTRYIRARPYAPSAADLAALSGRYETDEIGAVEITPASNALSAQLNGSPLVQLTPVHPDVFQRGAMTIRFQRDVAGKVIGLDLSNPVLRNVRFLRRSVGTSPPAPAPAQARSSDTGLARYEGTYALEGPNRTLDLRVWVDAEGRLNGEMVGSGQQMIFRPSTEHKFLHPTQDDLWVLFTVDDGRATSVTMHSPNREISGPRKQ